MSSHFTIKDKFLPVKKKQKTKQQKKRKEKKNKKMYSYKFRKIHRKTPVPESLFNKVAGLRPCRPLLKKRFWHRCFPVDFAKFLRTPFLTEHPVSASVNNEIK